MDTIKKTLFNEIVTRELKQNMKIYTGIIVFVILVILAFDVENLKKVTAVNITPPTAIFAAAILLIIAFVASQQQGFNAVASQIKMIALVATFCIVGYVFIYFLNMTNVKISNVMIVLLAVGVLVGLSLTHKVLISHLKKQQGITGFIINLIFYLPCLLNEFIEFSKQQFLITTNTTFILLLIEFVILFLYFYISSVENRNPKTVLLKNPVNLNDEIVVADNMVSLMNEDVLAVHNNGVSSSASGSSINKNTEQKQVNNYSITFWFYVNQSNKHDGIFNIFEFKENKLHVSYDVRQNACFVKCSPNNDVIVIDDMPLQRWNYFVVVYRENIAEIYLNGVMTKTQKFISNPVSDKDSVVVGQNDGLQGAITDVNFYHHPLKKHEIAHKYERQRKNNPP